MLLAHDTANSSIAMSGDNHVVRSHHHSNTPPKKKCTCTETDVCQGLTTAFRMMDDPRQGFVKIPRYHKKGDNKVRASYLKYLLPTYNVNCDTRTRYIAVHHFHPSLSFYQQQKQHAREEIIPQTLSKKEASMLGIELDECDTMFDEQLHRVYIVVPNYPLEKTKADVTALLNQVLSESSKDEIEQISSKDEDIVASAAACGDKLQRNEHDNEGILSDVQKDMNDSSKGDMSTENQVIVADMKHSSNSEETRSTEHPFERDERRDSSGSLPDDFRIVSITSLDGDDDTNENVRENFLTRAKNDNKFLISPSAAEEEEETEPNPRPAYMRAESEPPPHIKGILRHANTVSNDQKGPVRNVNFGVVNIREYPIIPGDNPGGVSGPPLTIDWQFNGNMSAKIDEYEEMRPKRRTAADLIMPSDVRYKLLRSMGHSPAEIQKYTKKANLIRRSRKNVVEMRHMSNISEAKERLTRGLSNLTLKRGKKQKEREFIQNALQMNAAQNQNKSQPTDPLSSDEEQD